MTRNFVSVAIISLILNVGCQPSGSTTKVEKLPTVTISYPVAREITDYEDFTGRTEAVQAVDVKARASGYLVHIGFQSGSIVKGDDVTPTVATGLIGHLAGSTFLFALADLAETGHNADLLFVVDPRPYVAALDQAIAQHKLAKAQLSFAKSDSARAKQLSKTPGAISQQDIDKAVAGEEQAYAQVDAAAANVQKARLDLEFTRVTSPISGKISWNYLTLGNLVTKDQTLLTTVVSEDPLYAYFDVDERTVYRIRKLMRAGKLKSTSEGGSFPVFVGLANEKGNPHKGVVDMVNNRVDSSTGTITVRAMLPNAKPDVGPRFFLPGQFVRIRMPLGGPTKALLVSEKALGSDQGLKFVMVVDSNGEVQQRRVKLGPLQDDGLRVIEEGVGASDQIIVSGLQDVRPKMKVQVETIDMPQTGSLARESEASKGPAAPGR